MSTSDLQQYYGGSDNELAQRYVKDQSFLSPAYCAAALEHRYGLYPFIHEFAAFSSWKGKRVLEVGCGQGADLSQFAAAGAATFGCDLTFKHCDVSRRFVGVVGERASVLQASATRLPYQSESFDLVYSFGVLLLIEDVQAAVAEIHRVLRPGGRVIAMFYNRESLHYYVKTLYYYGVVCDLEALLGSRRLVDWFTDGYGYPRTFHQSPESLRELFRGFTIEKLAVRNFTPDQLPLLPVGDYPPAFWSWVASRLGFFLMITART
jgi:SAM-dependent methyltransferase